MRFLLSLGLLCFTTAAPLLEESVEEALQQSQADRDGAASWSKDLINNWPTPKRNQDQPGANPEGVWKGQNILETAGVTFETRKKGLARHTVKEAVEMETISSLLRDIENSIPSSDASDSDDDDTQASEENFNPMNREEVDDTDAYVSFDDLTIDGAEVQKWKSSKSLLGKGLRVLKHKLRSQSRTPEDRQAVNNPTIWKDLARNFLGIAGDKRDPRTMEDVSEEQTIEEAEIEKLKIFKKIFKKVVKGIKKFVKLLKKIKPKIKNRPRQRYDDDDMNDRNRPYKYATVNSDTSIGVHGNYVEEKERELAEIQGFRSFLVDALSMINSKLSPRSRTDEEDRETVRNLQKCTDLACNFLNTLKKKLERRTGSGPGQLEHLRDELPSDAASKVDQTWTTDRPNEMSQEQSLFKLYRKLIRKIRRNRSG